MKTIESKITSNFLSWKIRESMLPIQMKKLYLNKVCGSPCGPWPVPCLLRLTTRQESGQRDLLKAVTTTTCNKQLPSSVSRALGGTCGVTQPPERWPWKSRREGGGLHSSASPAWPRVNLSPSVVSLPSSRVSQAPEGGLRWVPSRAGHSSCGCSVDVTGLSNS